MQTADKLDLERLILIAQGHTAFQLLWAGIELGLFNHLAQHPNQPRPAIAAALGLQDYPCDVLLVGLTALGLIRRDDAGLYRNAELTERMLVAGRPEYLGGVLGWQARIVYPGLQDFVASLRAGRNLGLERFPGTGATLYERLIQHPELERIFQDSMSALSAHANTALLEAFDFGRFTHVVDAGGGDATNALALARRFPHLRVTVFDSASVCRLAQANIERAGLGDRVFTWAGDFRTDPFPPGIDAVLYCHIATIWSLKHNRELFRKTHDALPAGGALLLFNMMADDDERGPLSTALGSPYFLAIATGEGKLHPWKDYERCLNEAGFQGVQRIGGLPLNHGLLIGWK